MKLRPMIVVDVEIPAARKALAATSFRDLIPPKLWKASVRRIAAGVAAPAPATNRRKRRMQELRAKPTAALEGNVAEEQKTAAAAVLRSEDSIRNKNMIGIT